MKSKIIIAGLIVIAGLASAFFWTLQGTDPDQLLNKIEDELQKAEDRPVVREDKILLDVPFTSQAPNANWADDHFQDGCEEASLIMVSRWVWGSKIGTKNEVEAEIYKISEFEKQKFGTYHDTSAEDTLKVLNEYFNHKKVAVFYDMTVEDIKLALSEEKLVVVPADGTRLGNPNFRRPGPTRHMLVIRGFDEKDKQFITNDPGTRKGEKYRYDYKVLINAVRDYPTGHKEEILEERKAMIVVEK